MQVLILLISGAVPAVLSIALGANVMLSIIGGLLLAIGLFLWGFLRSLRRFWRARAFVNQLKPIPQDDNDIKAWVDQSVSLLRGVGFPRKAQILEQLIQKTQPENRVSVAEKFLFALPYDQAFAKGLSRSLVCLFTRL